MRTSADSGDPGYHPCAHILPVTFKLDGETVDRVVTADDVKGELVVFERDRHGSIIPNAEGIAKLKTLTGKVEINIQCPKHKSYGAMRRPRCDCKECWAMWEFLSSK